MEETVELPGAYSGLRGGAGRREKDESEEKCWEAECNEDGLCNTEVVGPGEEEAVFAALDSGEDEEYESECISAAVAPSGDGGMLSRSPLLSRNTSPFALASTTHSSSSATSPPSPLLPLPSLPSRVMMAMRAGSDLSSLSSLLMTCSDLTILRRSEGRTGSGGRPEWKCSEERLLDWTVGEAKKAAAVLMSPYSSSVSLSVGVLAADVGGEADGASEGEKGLDETDKEAVEAMDAWLGLGLPRLNLPALVSDAAASGG